MEDNGDLIGFSWIMDGRSDSGQQSISEDLIAGADSLVGVGQDGKG